MNSNFHSLNIIKYLEQRTSGTGLRPHVYVRGVAQSTLYGLSQLYFFSLNHRRRKRGTGARATPLKFWKNRTIM